MKNNLRSNRMSLNASILTKNKMKQFFFYHSMFLFISFHCWFFCPRTSFTFPVMFYRLKTTCHLSAKQQDSLLRGSGSFVALEKKIRIVYQSRSKEGRQTHFIYTHLTHRITLRFSLCPLWSSFLIYTKKYRLEFKVSRIKSITAFVSK